jgi:hypothetical protein
MGVSTFVQPDFTSQSATVYKTSIDDGFAVHQQIAGAFAPHEQTVPNLTVRLDAANFSDLVSRTTVTHAAQSTGALTAPSVDPRKDIVHVDRITGDVGVVTGAEAASPVDPTIPVGKLPVARINWTTSTTEITNADLDDIRAIGGLGLSTAAFTDLGTTDGLIPTLNADGGLTFVGLGTGPSAGPIVDLYRDSTSPAVNDTIGGVDFNGNDAALAKLQYGLIEAQIRDLTAAAETARLRFRTLVGGSFDSRMELEEGLQLGSPTDGDKGPGTVNAENGFYDDGVLLESPGMTLIASASLSAVASADFTSIITSIYRRYKVVYDNLIPVTDGDQLRLRTSTNNSTFDAGASDYTWAIEGRFSGGNLTDEDDTSDFIQIAGDRTATSGIGNGSSEGASGHFWINDPLDAAIKTTIYGGSVYWLDDVADAIGRQQFGGARKSAADVDAFQILFSSGNIASGEIRVYGIKDA